MHKPLTIFALLLLCFLSSCGTISNIHESGPLHPALTDKVEPFGGVMIDGMLIAIPFAVDDAGLFYFSIFGVIDFPLSLAGDIITLPYTLVAVNEVGVEEETENNNEEKPTETD